jgi:hypothetical protein
MTIQVAGAPLRLPVERWSIAQRPMQDIYRIIATKARRN